MPADLVQGGYCKVEKAVQHQCQHQSGDSAQKAQQKTGGGDEDRISHAAASSPACQPKWDGQRQAEKPGGAEGNQPRPCDDNTGKVIDLPAPEIRPCRAHKSDEEQRPLQDGCHGSAAQRAGVVEHILDTLVQGGHDYIAEQSVEASQQQSTQHHGDEDLDGGVDVALTGAAGGGKADGLGADGIGSVLDKLLRVIISSYKLYVSYCG